MMPYDFETMKATKPVALINHRCCRCGGTIAAGTRYNRTVMRIDGELETQKSHGRDNGCDGR